MPYYGLCYGQPSVDRHISHKLVFFLREVWGEVGRHVPYYGLCHGQPSVDYYVGLKIVHCLREEWAELDRYVHIPNCGLGNGHQRV